MCGQGSYHVTGRAKASWKGTSLDKIRYYSYIGSIKDFDHAGMLTMTETLNLKLPFLAASQAQKHVTVNETILMIDQLLHCSVARPDAGAPPSASEGERFIVPTGALGPWAAHVNAIAVWQDGAWRFHAPLKGWVVWSGDEQSLLVFSGSVWQKAASSAGAANLLVNGDFAINQRRFAGGSLAANTYGFDRWRAGPAGASVSKDAANLVTLASGNLVQVVEVGLWGTGSLAGQTVTVSAQDVSANMVVSMAGVSSTIPAGAGRRSAQLAVPPGATGDLGLTLASAAGTVAFRNIKLETGAMATPWSARHIQAELALCQRYFSKSHAIDTAPANGQPGTGMTGAAVNATLLASQRVSFPTPMRAPPGVALLAGQVGTPVNGRWAYNQSGSWTYASSASPVDVDTTGFTADLGVTGATSGSSYRLSGGWTASAEL